MEELAISLEWLISQYESVGAKKEVIDDFISCCKEILPKRPEDGWIDSSKTVDEATLEKINNDLAQILQIFGGDDYVRNWNAREDQQGQYPVSGVNETLDVGLTEDNVKSYLWDIGARICQEIDEEKVPYVWNNWNYDYEILNNDTKTMKQYRDIAELIVESIGWRVEVVKNPYELIVDNFGVQNFERYDTLENALKNVNDSNADYCVRISKAGTVKLTYELLTTCRYRKLVFEVCDEADYAKYYYSDDSGLPVNGELTFRGRFFEFDNANGGKIAGNAENAVLWLEVEEGQGDFSYDKLKVMVNVDRDRWNGIIENGDNEYISQATQKLNALLTLGEDYSGQATTLVKEILNNLAVTDEFGFDFNPDNIVKSSLSEKVWAYSEQEHGAVITIKDEGFTNEELIKAIGEVLKVTVTKYDGEYILEFKDYLPKLYGGITPTKQDEKDALHSFMWWFGRVLLMGTNYKTWESRVADIKNSVDADQFTANIKTCLEALAVESANGREKMFFWDFKNSEEDSGLWTAKQIEEGVENPYHEEVTFNWDSLESDKVFAWFKADMADPDCKRNYIVYVPEDDSVVGVYDAMASFIWAVAEYQKNAREGYIVIPSTSPSEVPEGSPSEVPEVGPSEVPEVGPSEVPEGSPSASPEVGPSEVPEASPSLTPIETPTPTPIETPTPSPTEVQETPESNVPEEPITTTKNEGNKTITTTTTIDTDTKTGAVTKTEKVLITDEKNKTSQESTVITTTLKNGDMKTSENTKIMDKKGKVTKTIDISKTVDSKTGMEVEVREEKNSKGKVTDKKATIIPGAESSVRGKNTDITLQFQMDSVLEMVNGNNKGEKMDLSINISGDTILNEINKSTSGNVNLFVETQKELNSNKNIKNCTLNLGEDILTNAKKSGNNLKISIGDGSSQQKTLYEWTFSKADLKNAENLKDLDLSLSIQKPAESKNTDAGKIIGSIEKSNSKVYKQIMNNSIVCCLGDNGELGCEAEVKMYVGDYAKKNTSYYLYYANPKTNKLEAVPYNSMKVKNGYISVKLKHCSDYIFTAEKLSDDVATPLADQIKGIASSKKINKGKSFTIKPVLPSTLNKVKKITKKDGADMEVVITYQSSNKNIATVGKTSGKVTGKKQGTCIITTNILFADGTKKTVKTKVSVK